MPSYYVNEAMFVLPELGFVDHTLHRLELPQPGTEGTREGSTPLDPLGIEIRRVRMEPGKGLRELVDGDTAATQAKVNGFTILDQTEVAVSDAPAILLRARFRARDMAYYQLKAHVALDRTWMIFAVTAPFAERVRCDETFERMLESLEWRSG
jgi:hypothetical protein